MTSRLLIVGAGAQARYVIETVRRTQGFAPVGLVDTFDNAELWGRRIDDVEVLGGSAALDDLAPEADLWVVLAVADIAHKQHLAAALTERGFRFASIVHPAALIASDVTVESGTIINAGAVIERGSRIGAHVLIHAGCVIEHDNIIDDFANLAPGVVTAGRVQIQAGATVFTGARVAPNIVIGKGAVVGAGAVVIRPVPAGQTVVGVPARELRRAAN